MKKVVKNKKENKKLNKQEWTLIATFIFLIILVIALIIVALNIKTIASNRSNDITIPILEEHSKNEISVDISNMKKSEEKEYIFAITNYKDYDVNEKKIDYDINISFPESVVIELYKNNNKNNLLADNQTIENNILDKNDKEKDTYKLIIKSKSPTSENAKITIEINS